MCEWLEGGLGWSIVYSMQLMMGTLVENSRLTDSKLVTLCSATFEVGNI